MRSVTMLMAIMLTLSGCAQNTRKPQPAENPAIVHPYGITEIEHKLKNGLTVTCLLWNRDAGYDSGMSCDWDNTR